MTDDEEFKDAFQTEEEMEREAKTTKVPEKGERNLMPQEPNINLEDVERALRALTGRYINEYNDESDQYNHAIENILLNAKSIIEYTRVFKESNVEVDEGQEILKNCYTGLMYLCNKVDDLDEYNHSIDQDREKLFGVLYSRIPQNELETFKQSLMITQSVREYIKNIDEEIENKLSSLKFRKGGFKAKKFLERFDQNSAGAVREVYDEKRLKELFKEWNRLADPLGKKFARAVRNAGKKVERWAEKVSNAARSAAKKISGRGRGGQ